MDTCTNEQEYINQIAEPARRCCARYGYLPSVLIAQSCLENGYGIPEYWDNQGIRALVEANNMVGIKTGLLNGSWTDIGLSVWPGKSITKRTPEEYNGRAVTIVDSFRAYDSIEQSFADYLLFMTYASNDGAGGDPKYGGKVLGIKDPAALIREVSALGYATGSGYAGDVIRIINKNDLTRYDDIAGVMPTDFIPDRLRAEKEGEEMGIEINRQYITTHNTNSTNDPIYIVIHNTDNERKGADAKAHAEGLYNGDMEDMSWHYVVDDHSWYQCINHNRGAWHVGKNYGSNNLFGIVHNRNSICIEMCVNAGYDYEAAFQNTVMLTRYLMKETGIDADHVLSHYDVCSKDCPSAIRAHGDWGRFKQLITEEADEVPEAKQEEKKNVYVAELKVLHRGDNCDDVGTLQLGLRARDYKGENGKPIKVDKDFGGNTEHALREFQKDHGLKVDGWCGVLTWPVVLGKA